MEEQEKVELDQIINQIPSMLKNKGETETTSKKLSTSSPSLYKAKSSLKKLTQKVLPGSRGLTVNKKRKSRILRKIKNSKKI